YQPLEEQLAEPSGLPRTVALVPISAVAQLRTRVIASSGDPLPRAVVELVSTNPAAMPRVAVTDEKGVVSFADVPSESFRLIAGADGFVTSTRPFAQYPESDVVSTLSRGYRVMADVQLRTTGPYIVRVVNERGVSMDDLLDGESDRRVESPGRLFLGPLPP